MIWLGTTNQRRHFKLAGAFLRVSKKAYVALKQGKFNVREESDHPESNNSLDAISKILLV